MPAVSRGRRAPIGIGAPAPPKPKRAGAAEKRAKKRVKAARAAAPRARAPAAPVVAPFDDTPRTLGRGRNLPGNGAPRVGALRPDLVHGATRIIRIQYDRIIRIQSEEIEQ